jgi:hypothetical protein
VALIRPTATAPRVYLLTDRSASGAMTGAPVVGRGAVTLAALAMAPEERQRFEAALEELGDRLDVRANPLADDLADAPPDAALRRLLPAALPKLTAAEALLAAAWRGSAGGFVVRAVASCPPEAECVDPRARGGTAAARRARFLAWPLSGAARLELPDADAATRAATRLRTQAAAADSRIALVLGGDPPRGADLPALRAHAARVAHRLQQAGGDPRLIDRLLDTAKLSLPAWLALEPRQLVIIPRLGSIAALPEMVREIEALVPEATWLERPSAPSRGRAFAHRSIAAQKR